ncbi:MAG: ferritin [Bacteroidales bacterium]|nr:ferritin [Bacteroidales bacterium]
MIPKEIAKILNEQIEKEIYSSNLYLAMAIWCDSKGYEGSSKWLYDQAEEERMHGFKFIHYLVDVDEKAVVPALKKPPVSFKDIKTLFDMVLKHEQFISDSINEIVKVCHKTNDYRTMNWIQYFVQEQIEEESTVRTIIDKLKLAGDKNIFWFDKEMVTIRGAGNTNQ